MLLIFYILNLCCTFLQTHSCRMKVEKFRFQAIQLGRSCGEFTCNGGHDPEVQCVGYESTNPSSILSLQGELFVMEPECMRSIKVTFRSRKMSEIFVHRDLLEKEVDKVIDLINPFDLFDAAKVILKKYEESKTRWNFVAWWKPSYAGTLIETVKIDLLQ
jgi:hypothetical protein